MLRTMRQNMKSLSIALWIVVAAFIGTIFLVWGRGSQRGGRDVLAHVGDKVITYMEYRKAYVKSYDFYRKMFGSKFNEDLVKKLHLKEQVLNSLINDKLVEVVAEKEGIKVYPKEVVDEIARMEVFKTNGGFDPKKYERVLQVNRLTPEEFEEDVRRSLLKEKVLTLVEDSTAVAKAEVRDEIVYGMEKVKVEYVELSPRLLTDRVKVSPGDLKTYYEKHKEEFRVPDKVKITYLPFIIEGFKRRVKVSETEVERYYQENKEDFPASPQLHLLVISVKDKKTLARVLDALKKGEFSKVARRYSLDFVASKGGDMGWVTLSNLPPPVSRALKSVSVGGVSSPVKVDGEYKIFKLVDKKEGGVKSLEEVKGQILERLLAEKARKEALRTAAKARKMLREGVPLEEVSKRLGVGLVSTPLLARDGVIPGVPSSFKLLQVAFALQERRVSDIIRTPEGFYILRVQEKRRSYVPSLDEVKARVEEAVKLEKAGVLLDKEGGKLAQLAKKKGWKGALKELGISGVGVKESSYFTRADAGAWGKDLVDRAFAMDKGMFSWIHKGKKVLVFRLVDHRGVSETVISKLFPQVERILLERRRRELLDQWLKELRERVEVKVNQKLWEAL